MSAGSSSARKLSSSCSSAWVRRSASVCSVTSWAVPAMRRRRPSVPPCTWASTLSQRTRPSRRRMRWSIAYSCRCAMLCSKAARTRAASSGWIDTSTFRQLSGCSAGRPKCSRQTSELVSANVSRSSSHRPMRPAIAANRRCASRSSRARTPCPAAPGGTRPPAQAGSPSPPVAGGGGGTGDWLNGRKLPKRAPGRPRRAAGTKKGRNGRL